MSLQKTTTLKSFVKNKVRDFAPSGLKGVVQRLNQLVDPYASITYSQEGEDRILSRLLSGQDKGFYVDVGAHHPMRFSNTCLLYQAGWSGINIDPNPDFIQLFEYMRPRDINLQIGIADQPGELKYFQFSDSALNTFDESLAQERQRIPDYFLVNVCDIQVERLDRVLESNITLHQIIDLLLIDAEGFDLHVVKSNNWNRYRPKFVLVESSRSTFQGLEENKLHNYMCQVGYDLIAKTPNTLFYRDLP